MIHWITTVLDILTLPIRPIIWLVCRINARRCPNCQSKWWSELIGEWEGEDWKCHNCGQWWNINNT